MKNKVIWAVALSILIFGGFMGKMSQLKDNGIFYLKDIEGQREYLNLFPIEGVAGDGTQGIIFRLEDGALSTKFYPFDSEQVNNLFFAEREGIKGMEKYNYNYYNQDFRKGIFASTDSAPSKDAKIQHMDSFYEEIMDDMDFYGDEFVGGETDIADKVDVYLDIWGMDFEGQARIRTGMTLQNQDQVYYYTRGDYEDGLTSFTHSFLNDGMQEVDGFCAEIGDAYYCMAIPSAEIYGMEIHGECQGDTSLFRIKQENMIEPPELDKEEELYQQREYGNAEVLCTFPVDENNRVLEAFAVGDHSLGIFRVQNESLFFEIYDTEGNMIAQDLLTKEQGSKVDQIEANVVAWNENDVSIYFRTYQVVKDEDNYERWEGIIDGMYQFDEKGLKRMHCYGDNGGKLLSVCRNNLILDVSMVSDEQRQLPYYYGYQVYVSVINGDTGKILYRGKFETDYDEDLYKLFSPYNIAKDAPYLEEAMKAYNVDGIITQRQRQITNVLPINGKVENVWWR
ncbi:hypothetical protein [Anaerotignum sp.]|uniref:hypothetical protein n=1 Tax=Anaerotignum sp. TaxID=2039241 RepID=UPI002714E061|nr:hypothetical protein [Anaerotignum sp.]